MKIVLIGPAFPLRGGIAHYTALLYRNLTERGHDVHVISFKRQYPSLLFPGKTQLDEGEELITVNAVHILDSIGPFSWIRAFFYIRQLQPDLIIFNYWMPFFAPCYATVAGLAKKFLSIKNLYILHNVIPHEKKPFDGILTRFGLKFIDFFITQARSVRDDLLSLNPAANYRETPHPIYNIFPEAVDQKAVRNILGIGEERVLLYFGYIRKYKGLKFLVQAMPLIRESIKDIRLMICGEFYEGREEILALIESLELDNCVTLVDEFIPNEEVGRYFSAADLIVLPYITATQSGIVQIAYNYDKPVVVTRVGGLPEVVPDGESGYVVEPQDPEAIARAVINFYQDGQKDILVDGVRRQKDKYSWDRMGEAIESFFSTTSETGIE
ncbi:glycosyltransferase [bacterium]|nr:glycosyltransferase [bacterium]